MADRVALYNEFAGTLSRMPTATITLSAPDSLNPSAADYPCTGSGDATTIQAALDACAAAGGGIVQATEGHFRPDDQILPPSGVTLLGRLGATVFQFADDVADKTMFLFNGKSNAGLKWFTINGNGDNCSGNINGIFAYNSCAHLDFAGLTLMNGLGVGYGIVTALCSDVTIERCWLDPWANDSLELRETNGAKVLDNTFNGGNFEVYCKNNAQDIEIAHNRMYDLSLRCTDNGSPMTNLRVIDNTVRCSASASLYWLFHTVDGLIIARNTLDASASTVQTAPVLNLNNTAVNVDIDDNVIRLGHEAWAIKANCIDGRVTRNRIVFNADAQQGVHTDDASAAGLMIGGNDFIGDGSMPNTYGVSLVQVAGAEIYGMNRFSGIGHGVYVGAASSDVNIGDDNRYDDVDTDTEVA